MMRRFYVLPLKPTVGPAQVDELLAALRATDQYIPGLVDSSAGLDVHVVGDAEAAISRLSIGLALAGDNAIDPMPLDRAPLEAVAVAIGGRPSRS
jgi:hypothetical protein